MTQARFDETWAKLSDYQRKVLLAALHGNKEQAVWDMTARDMAQRELERMGLVKRSRTKTEPPWTQPLCLTLEGWALATTAIHHGLHEAVETEKHEDPVDAEVT